MAAETNSADVAELLIRSGAYFHTIDKVNTTIALMSDAPLPSLPSL